MEAMEDCFVLVPLEQHAGWGGRRSKTASVQLGRIRVSNKMVTNSPCRKIEANVRYEHFLSLGINGAAIYQEEGSITMGCNKRGELLKFFYFPL